jgi:putative NADPH-quinone reductase
MEVDADQMVQKVGVTPCLTGLASRAGQGVRMTEHRILLIQGHPDASKPHFGHALEDAYAAGAAEVGHGVWRLSVAQLDFPLLRSQHEWEHGQFGRKGLTGRSARVVVTMGMPAVVYRWYFRAHSVKSLERNILGFVGIAPVRETLIGLVGNLSAEASQKHLDPLRALGARAV